MSENAVAVREEITKAKVMEYLDAAGITNTLLDNEKQMFFNMARAFCLDPFKREIHITAYGQGDRRKCTIITGYEVYIKRAERTGKLDGWKVWTEGEGKALKAIVEIYRKDQKYPFSHEVYYSECVQMNKDGYPNAVWAKQPRFMTKKVAIGQAFRLCFPDDLGGMPYEESELPQDEPRNVTEETLPDNEASKNNGTDLAREAHEEPKNVTESQEDTTPAQSNEVIELKELLEKGNIGKGFVKAAENALKNGDMNTIRGILKKHKADSVNHQRGDTKEREKLTKSTGEILKTLDPDQMPYFTTAEVVMERAVAKGAHSVELLKNQNERLKKELAKREAAFQAVPFGDMEKPEFNDDIPVF